MALFEESVSEFTGRNGDRHAIGYVLEKRGGGRMLVDSWSGHGLRLLCVVRQQDFDSDAQVDAVIREYRPDACLSNQPLSRRVDRAEFHLSPQAATVSG